MKKNLVGMIVALAVVLSAVFVFQAFGPASSAQGDTPSSIVRGNDPLHEPQQANLGGETQASSALIPVTGAPESTGLTLKSCYSTDFHAATECDRLASGPYLNQTMVNASNGPISKDCYSSAYHAAGDCDRFTYMNNFH